MSVEVLKEELRNLSKQDQVDLMHFLVELLSAEATELSDAWKAELDKRAKSFQSGASTGRPAREVLERYLSR